MSQHPYRHKQDGLRRMKQHFSITHAWLPFVAMTNKPCPHARPIFHEPLRGRLTCYDCRDIIVWREFVSCKEILELGDPSSRLF